MRRQLWLGQQGHPYPNLAALGHLIQGRQKLARALGHESHAHRTLGPRVLGSPREVANFLEPLARALKPFVSEELDLLRARGLGAEAWPWEEIYWRGRASGPQKAQSQLMGFLSLAACWGGLEKISERLFGLTLREGVLGPGEAWARNVPKLGVMGPGGRVIGTVYLDLFARRGKFAGCAHFTLQCGVMGPGECEQLPSVALVCSLPEAPEPCGPLLSLQQA